MSLKTHEPQVMILLSYILFEGSYIERVLKCPHRKCIIFLSFQG